MRGNSRFVETGGCAVAGGGEKLTGGPAGRGWLDGGGTARGRLAGEAGLSIVGVPGRPEGGSVGAFFILFQKGGN
jgi:hypothetical protein